MQNCKRQVEVEVHPFEAPLSIVYVQQRLTHINCWLRHEALQVAKNIGNALVYQDASFSQPATGLRAWSVTYC